MDDPSSPASSPATSGSRLTGPLAGRTDLDLFTPAPEQAREVMAAIAAYCRDYCPAVHSCVEDACRLYRLEGRSLEALKATPSDNVGVLGTPVIGL